MISKLQQALNDAVKNTEEKEAEEKKDFGHYEKRFEYAKRVCENDIILPQKDERKLLSDVIIYTNLYKERYRKI